MHSSLTSILARLRALPLRAESPAKSPEETLDERLGELVGSRAVDVLKSFRPTTMTQAVVAWEVSPAWVLFLHGGVGCGKTVAAAWAARRELVLNSSVAFERGTSAATYGIFGQESAEKTRRAKRAGLLVLDDVGAEMVSAPWLSWLEDVIGDRHASQARTVITSNLNPAAFRSRYGDRIADRLKEGLVVGTNEPSMRVRTNDL